MTHPACPRWCATGPHADPTTPHESGTLTSAELADSVGDAVGSMLISAALIQEHNVAFPQLRIEHQGSHVVELSTEQLHRAATELLNLGLYLTVLGDRLDLVEVLGSWPFPAPSSATSCATSWRAGTPRV